MPLKPEVDKDLCISSGKCVADYPRAFAFDDEELAEELPTAGELSDEELISAARNCPSGAIVVRDVDGNEIDVF